MKDAVSLACVCKTQHFIVGFEIPKLGLWEVKFRESCLTNIFLCIRYSKFSSKKKAITMSIFKPEIQIFKAPYAIFVEKTMWC